MLGPAARAAYYRGDLADIAFADDTLLIGVSCPHISEYLAAVEISGRRFGMELHHDKFQLLQVNADGLVHLPSGTAVPASPSMGYLGTTLAEDGRIRSELGRRIGIARADFDTLSRVWSHSALGRKRKLSICHALVESKLLHGLATVCMNVAELRRLNGFQNKCLRKILGISSSFLSRVSNKTVMQHASCKSASAQLLAMQLRLLRKVVLTESVHPLRSSCMVGDTLQPLVSHYIRRVGRPRKEWLSTVLPHGLQIVSGNAFTIREMMLDKHVWKQLVKRYV
jgi:hypothetical protein